MLLIVVVRRKKKKLPHLRRPVTRLMVPRLLLIKLMMIGNVSHVLYILTLLVASCCTRKA